ncbi:MAG: hypothetical protein A2W85_14020 [Bacteroidetes bacterium GWF2_41_31]|nr:MAG: hypothetical protein A2W85_14020 [Bacteroidetes bacterium GWF2_41_31]OFZ09685.1 MAG: hypothetical protein A2338_04440 [Bacteroidetes bacterium RIFOXYB12_FULL_41_6]
MQKLIIFIMFFALFPLVVLSQSKIRFEHDNAGNRIIREVSEFVLTSSPQTGINDSVDNFKITQLEEISYKEEIDGIIFKIFPNPTGGQFTVEMNDWVGDHKISMFLHTVSGELIFHEDNVLPVNLVDIRDKENGTYLLTFVVDGHKKTWKVIKQ